MKVFVNNKVYVQKKDLQFLLRECDGISIAPGIINEVLDDIFIVNDNNKHEFIKFSNVEDVDFFKNCDWIIDYHALDGMTEVEIINYGSQINDKRNELAEKFNNLPEKEQEKLYEQVSSEVMMLDYKIYSIRDLVWHRQGHLKFTVPTGNEVEHTVSEANELPSKENIFKRVLKK